MAKNLMDSDYSPIRARGIVESIKFLAIREAILHTSAPSLPDCRRGATAAKLFLGPEPKFAGRPFAYMFARNTVGTTLGLWVSFFCVLADPCHDPCLDLAIASTGRAVSPRKHLS